MKNYSINGIYYGYILKSNINLLKNIDNLHNYIGKWEQDDGSLYKFFEIAKKDNRFYIQMEVDIDNSIAMFYTNEGYIDFDFKTHRFKARAFELGTDKLTDCYYSFYSYNSYLAVVDHNQNNEKCVVDQPFNLSGIYKVSHNNN